MTVRTSVLDLGSNSFHVLVADLDGSVLVPVLREREMLHLGAAVARTGEVPEASLARAVDTVSHLAGLARRKGAVELHGVATAAIRDAANGPQVLAALAAAAGAEIRVLDGAEEARLGELGVRASVAIAAEPLLVLDLGGGSLELTVSVGDQVRWSTSLPIGASRLTALVDTDPLSAAQVAAVVDHVDGLLDPVVEVARSHAPGVVVAVGGTVRALARIVARREGWWVPATLNQLRLTTEQLAELRELLVAAPIDERRALPGMKSKRADHLHVAALALTRTLERLGVAGVTVSDWGLREGLLLDAYGVTGAPAAATLRLTEIERLRTSFVPDDPHPPHVAHLAAQLFDATTGLHGLAPVDRELLTHAARVHAIGEALALRRQHEHGAYLLQHAELRGFDPSELALLTSLVRFHPSRGIDTDEPCYAGLGAGDRTRVHRLLALLQVADALDRAGDQAVSRVRATTTAEALTLHLDGRGLHLTGPELAHRGRWFRRVFDRELVLDDRGGA